MKKLSEYDAMDGLKVLGRLNRAIAPFAKDRKFMASLRASFTKADKKDTAGSGLIVFMELVELITTCAPGLIIELVAIMSDTDKKDVESANLLDIIDALMLLGDDVRLLDFLSKRFSLGENNAQST